MKTRFFVLAALLLSLVSCRKDPLDDVQPGQTLYKGTVSVDWREGTHDNENIYVAFRPSEDGKKAEIVIYRIKFVPAMPVTIDVTIPDISVSGNTFSCDDVVPWALGGAYPKYTVYGLEGSITEESLSFSLKFGEYPTRFNGTVNKE